MITNTLTIWDKKKLGGGNYSKDNLIFEPSYLTNTDWVSKTDSVPVLSLNGIDNHVTTPITINANLNIEIQFRYNKCNNGLAYQYFYGIYSANSHFYTAVRTSDDLFLYGYGNATLVKSNLLVDKGIYNVKLVDKKFYFNDVFIKDFTNTPFIDIQDVFMVLGGAPGVQTGIDLMYCRLWDDNQEAIYTFNNTSGTVILDKSGNENNAVLSGTLTDCWSKRRVLLNNEDRTYISNIEKVKAKLVNSTCVQTNGINNSLLIYAFEHVGNLIEGLNINITFQTTNDIKSGDYSAILTKRNVSQSGSWGITKSNTNNLTFVYYNQDNKTMSHPLLNIATNTLYDIKLQILNSYVIITINDNIVLNQLIDLTDFELLSADMFLNGLFFGGSLYLPLKLLKFESSVNQVYNKVLNFTYNTNNTCYDQVTGTPYTISGDPVDIVPQNILHSQIINGFTVDGTNIYPPLLSNPMVDCVNQLPLTNPADNNAHNYANTELDLTTYINADPNEWAIEDGASERVWVKQLTTNLIQPFIYSVDLSVDEFNKNVLNYYSEYIIRDIDNNITYDSNGYIIVSLSDINNDIIK